MSNLSDKRLIANRQNAKLGGVKTEEGKAITRYNAVKHGLLSGEVVLKGEKQDELEELGKRLRNELKPVNEMEMILTEKIIADTWRLKRALRIEKQMIDNDCKKSDFMGNDTTKNLGEAFTHDFNNNDGYGKFTRYLSSIEHGIYRALHELQRLQAPRSGQPVTPVLVIDVETDTQAAMGSFGKNAS